VIVYAIFFFDDLTFTDSNGTPEFVHHLSPVWGGQRKGQGNSTSSNTSAINP
jgi:hypothetical protein